MLIRGLTQARLDFILQHQRHFLLLGMQILPLARMDPTVLLIKADLRFELQPVGCKRPSPQRHNPAQPTRSQSSPCHPR